MSIRNLKVNIPAYIQVVGGIILSIIPVTMSAYYRYKDKRGKIIFHIDFRTNELSDGDVYEYVVFKIINAGEQERTIDTITIIKSLENKIVRFQSSYKTIPLLKGKFHILELKISINKPTMFEEESFDPETNYLQEDENIGVKKIRIQVNDTLGKSYNSKWIKTINNIN